MLSCYELHDFEASLAASMSPIDQKSQGILSPIKQSLFANGARFDSHLVLNRVLHTHMPQNFTLFLPTAQEFSRISYKIRATNLYVANFQASHTTMFDEPQKASHPCTNQF